VSNGCRYGEIMDVSATDGDSGQEKLGRPRIHDNIEENTEVLRIMDKEKLGGDTFSPFFRCRFRILR